MSACMTRCFGQNHDGGDVTETKQVIDVNTECPLVKQILKKKKIIIIASKGAIWDFFYSFLTAPQTVSNTHTQVAICKCVQIMCNTSDVLHVQHVVCLVVRMDSSALKFDSV